MINFIVYVAESIQIFQVWLTNNDNFNDEFWRFLIYVDC